MVDVTVTIAGQAGQGIDTASDLFAHALARAGYYICAYPDVMSRIRGGHNFTAVRISDRPLYGGSPRHNLLLALDEASVAAHRAEMVEGGIMVAETRPGTDGADGVVRVPLASIAAEKGAPPAAANVVGLGVLLALAGHPLNAMLGLLKERFAAKGDKVVRQNVDCCRAGAEYVARHFSGSCPCALPALPGGKRRLTMTGSEALALGALASDVRFYAGYPMSPATNIMEFLSMRQKEFGLVVEQAEDEVGALNTVLGASYAGVRAMTATSGGGFSLMVEALGLSGMAELPCVVVLAQRPGPATGFPTRTEQAELLLAISASQDEFPRFVVAPGTAEAAFYAVNRAFEAAGRYQVPAIVLSDQLLSDSLWTVPELNLKRTTVSEDCVDNQWKDRPPMTYKRYALSPDGVSPRLRPGKLPQAVRSMGAEHTEDGFQTEDAGTRVAMQDKRMRKLVRMAAESDDLCCHPEDDATCSVVCWGSTYGAVREAVDILRAERLNVNMVHVDQLAPFPRERVLARLGRAKRIVTVELNSTGQLARLITRETRIAPDAEILKCDGRPFFGSALAEDLRRACEAK